MDLVSAPLLNKATAEPGQFPHTPASSSVQKSLFLWYLSGWDDMSLSSYATIYLIQSSLQNRKGILNDKRDGRGRKVQSPGRKHKLDVYLGGGVY